MIAGEKTMLRAVERQDIKPLWEWMQDEEIMRFRDYPAPPSSLEQALREFEDSLARESGSLRLAIVIQDGWLIGETGLRNIDHRTGSADFLIAIGNKSFWGKGFGTDATRALMRFAFQQLNLRRVSLSVHPFNERAIRAYEKVGFREEGRLREAEYMDGAFSDVLLMGLLRRDFEAVNLIPSSAKAA